MLDDLSFSAVCGSQPREIDIIFIHGLTGDPKDTWASEPIGSGTDTYWPKWLCGDFSAAGIFTLGYPASVFGSWAKKEMNLYEAAEAALEHLCSYEIGTRPIAFITHSLGGLLCKQMMRVARDATDSQWKSVFLQTRLIAFIATPHTGASLAGILKFALPQLSSTHIHILSNDSGNLDELNNAYREFAPLAGIKTVAYYEKHKTKNVALVVNQHSADPGIAGTRAIAIAGDHLSICKPKDKDSTLYRSLHRHIRNSFFKPMPAASHAGAFELDDFSHVSETDRRDLLTKLVDAGREHEYQEANDLQNKFAQRYYKLGLHTESRLTHDQLLSEVEQRFKLHVYKNKICKGASEDEIAKTLQREVLDAVANKFACDPTVTSSTVLKALYFLTERCHIRWDAT